jgi:hypothetical protein
MKIIRRLIDKGLELSIKKVTGHGKMHGIFLLEDGRKTTDRPT